jgi:hypothetical protein
MNYLQLKVTFIIISSVIALFIAYPLIQSTITYPLPEFTEMSLLGPQHMLGDYPYNITIARDYQVYLNVTNHLGSCSYYQIKVKFASNPQSSPNSFSGKPVSSNSLYNIDGFVASEDSWELPIKFNFNYSIINDTAFYNGLQLNNKPLDLRGLSSERNLIDNTLYGNLIFELWVYNGTTGTFQYNQRYVDLKLNMT